MSITQSVGEKIVLQRAREDLYYQAVAKEKNLRQNHPSESHLVRNILK